MRKTSAASHPVGRRQFLTLSAAGLAAAGLPRAAPRAGQAERRAGRRAVRADAHARSGQPLLDLRHLGAPARVRPAGGRDQRLEVRAGAGRVLAGRQQHHLALHAAEGRDVPRRHPVQRGQRRLHARAGDATTPSSSSPFVYQDIESVEKDGRLRGHGDLASGRSARCPRISPCSACCRPRAAKNEDAFFQKPIGTGPFRFVSWTHGDHIVLAANPSYWKPGPSHASRRSRSASSRSCPRGRRAARGGDPRGRPRHPRHGRDAQGQPRREGPRRARGRGPALDLPARQGAGEGPAAPPGDLARHRPERDHQGPAAGLRAAGGQPGPARADRPHQPARQAVRSRRRRGRSSSRPATPTCRSTSCS